MKGILFVLSGPSGTGKGTVCKEVLKRNKNIFLSVSATSRPIRDGETEGETYYYVSKEKFIDMIDNGEMLEYAVFNGNYYGTPKHAVYKLIESGRDVLLEIEPQGAAQVRKLFPEAELIFLLPPSMIELKQRLVSRGRESMDEIKNRLKAARWELLQADKYNTQIINDDLDDCVRSVIDYINTKHNQRQKIDDLLNEEI